MSTIYALVDGMGTPRYVGQTKKRLPVRLQQHRSAARRHLRPLDAWIRTEVRLSIVPLECRPDDADEAEQRWIAQMREGGLDLFNVTVGGRRNSTGPRHTAESKQRLSEARRGKPLSIEHRSKLSAAHRGVPLSEEHRLAIGKGGKGRIVTPAQRENMAVAKRGQANPMSRTNRLRREGVV